MYSQSEKRHFKLHMKIADEVSVYVAVPGRNSLYGTMD